MLRPTGRAKLPSDVADEPMPFGPDPADLSSPIATSDPGEEAMLFRLGLSWDDDPPSLECGWQEDVDTELPAPTRVARGEVTAALPSRHADEDMPRMVVWAVATGGVVTVVAGLGAAAWIALLG